MPEFVQPVADWQITLDGKDISPKLRPRLISLSIRETRGDEADQLDLIIDDTDGKLALPKPGAILSVSLGWKQGSGVRIGLVAKGLFKVDEVSHEGPPDQITLRARPVDFTAAAGQRREHSWHDSAIDQIVHDVAARNGWTPSIAADLADLPVKALVQNRESDIALLRRLGRQHDAVASIKAGHLVFKKIGSGKSVGGKALPILTIARRQGDRHTFSIQKRDDHKGVTASWHDKGSATREKITIGDASGAKHLKRVFATEADARRAARAESGRIGRRPYTMDLTLAFGQADIYPDRLAKVAGFKAEVDAINWLIADVTHELSKGGFKTNLKLERAA